MKESSAVDAAVEEAGDHTGAVGHGVAQLGGALLLGLLGLALSARRAALALLATLAITWGGAWYAFVHAQLLLDAVNPTWAMLLVFGLASGMHHWVGERQQRWLRSAFARYVSPNRVDHLVAHPEQLHLGGQRQVCSFVFTDLAGFTPLLEASDPAQMVGLLNDYLDGMLQIAFRHEGTLDRFVGDAMAVLFSAPVVQADHQQRALDCALDAADEYGALDRGADLVIGTRPPPPTLAHTRVANP